MPPIQFNHVHPTTPTLGSADPFSPTIQIYTGTIADVVNAHFPDEDRQIEPNEKLTKPKLLLGAMISTPYHIESFLKRTGIMKSPTIEESELYLTYGSKRDLRNALITHTSFVLAHEVAHKKLRIQKLLHKALLTLVAGEVVSGGATIAHVLGVLPDGFLGDRLPALSIAASLGILGGVWGLRTMLEVHANRYANKVYTDVAKAMTFNKQSSFHS